MNYSTRLKYRPEDPIETQNLETRVYCQIIKPYFAHCVLHYLRYVFLRYRNYYTDTNSMHQSWSFGTIIVAGILRPTYYGILILFFTWNKKTRIPEIKIMHLKSCKHALVGREVTLSIISICLHKRKLHNELVGSENTKHLHMAYASYVCTYEHVKVFHGKPFQR